MCEGAFSEERIFTVRKARAPLPPPLPTRDSKTSVSTNPATLGKAKIVLRWQRPVDNGGSPVTHYEVWRDDGSVGQSGSGMVFGRDVTDSE